MLLEQEQGGKLLNGNPGLTQNTAHPPAWPGFRAVQVSAIHQECKTVFSLLLTSDDGRPLADALPGQFVVLRIRPRSDSAPLLRSYSLSDAPSKDHYRVSVKEEMHGVVSGYLKNNVRVGWDKPPDLVAVRRSQPRGSPICSGS